VGFLFVWLVGGIFAGGGGGCMYVRMYVCMHVYSLDPVLT